MPSSHHRDPHVVVPTPRTPTSTRVRSMDDTDVPSTTASHASPLTATMTALALTPDASPTKLSNRNGLRTPPPLTPRAVTDPIPSPLLPTFHSLPPRARSPYGRTHLRSHSSTAPLSAPPMMRAHSSPTALDTQPATLTPSLRASSPRRSPARVRSPFGVTPPVEDLGVPSYPVSRASETIREDAELDLTPRAPADLRAAPPASPIPSTLAYNLTLPRRRRPASPLHQVATTWYPGSSAGTSNAGTPSSASSVTSSPLIPPSSRFNEAYPDLAPGSTSAYPRSFSSSSLPGTPTSARSRSPSISSLETIPDMPDVEAAEEQARRLELLRVRSEEQQRPRSGAAAEDGETSGSDGEPTRGRGFRRGSTEHAGGRGTGTTGGTGQGFGFGSARDKRKRWSVCGAERRQDLDLETIWED